MSLLKTIPPDQAVGGMKRIYDSFFNTLGTVPPPLVASSTSPVLQALLASCLIYYNEHRTLSQKLIAHIRFSTAVLFKLPSCIQMGRMSLLSEGVDENRIRLLEKDPGSADLREKEKDIFLFVLKALRDPDDVSQEDVSALKEMGWTDSDIFDALNVSAVMIGPGLMMKALKVATD